ncbi:TPA: glycosyltransferase family 4 protein [Vibrio campbellii]|uniref:glycosyltransferase family 4 protein n=1 Tax=Vibrio campbellii TaxID=680 RepID=UPI00390B4874
MKTINIGHNYFIVGGSDRVLVETVKLMNDNGHEAIPFCSKNRNTLNTKYEKYFVNSISTIKPNISSLHTFFYNFDAVKKLESLLDMHPDISIAHLHIYYGKITTSILSVLKNRNIKVIQSLHEYKLACPVYTMERNGDVCKMCIKGSFYNCVKYKCKNESFSQSLVMSLESYFSRFMGDRKKIDMFVSVSRFHKEIMIESGISSSKIQVLHNFVDVNSIPYIREHDGYFLYFGRIEKLKGIDTLLSAFSKTKHKLIIVGDGSYKEHLINSIRDISNIEYLGFKSGNELNKIISRAVGVIVPSEWYENCPMNVLEAKAYGKPVIGTCIGGIPELINDGKDGYIIPVKSPDLLAEKVELVFDNFHIFSKNSRTDCEERFSKETYYSKLMTIYS